MMLHNEQIRPYVIVMNISLYVQNFLRYQRVSEHSRDDNSIEPKSKVLKNHPLAFEMFPEQRIFSESSPTSPSPENLVIRWSWS